MSMAAHRLRRCRDVFKRVSLRLSEVGANCWLYGSDGTVLQGGGGGPSGLPDGVAGVNGPVVCRDGTDTNGWVWVPLGKATVDAWVVGHSADVPLAVLSKMMDWGVRDAEKMLALEETTSQLGDRLTQGYEQMHVLFGLARLIDGAEHPRAGVVRVLENIRTGLPFPWLAVKFGRSVKLRREMTGGFILSGQGGAKSAELIERGCDTILAEGNRQTRLVLRGDPSGLAERLGTELIVTPLRFEGETVGVLMAGDKNDEDPTLSSVEIQFLSACTDLLTVFHENLTRFADQRDLFMGTVQALTSAIDAKHRYTRGHSERVALLAKMMATDMGLGEQTANTYHLTGLLHDVGKIGVPENILSKPTKLTDEEFAVVKMHPRTGYEILKGIPHLDEVLPGVLHHHEQFCGRGYPDGLAGDSIPLIARVLALADTFDAMSSSRSYRSALSRQTVLTEITQCSGRQFDPALAPIFVKMDFTPLDELFARHTDQNAIAA